MAGVRRGELGQGLVKGQEPVVGLGCRQPRLVFVQRAPVQAATVSGGSFAMRRIDQDPAHRLGGRGKEMAAAVPVLVRVAPNQP